MRRRLALLAIGVALSGVSLAAHDMWIEPADVCSAGRARSSRVRLRVGQDLLGDPIPRDPSLINQFIVEDAAGRKPVVGRDGADPAGFVRVASPGMLVIGYSSKPSAVELPAEKFNQYLKEEGLDAVAAVRARRNETDRGAGEIFSRCAKSLVASGPPGGEGRPPTWFHAGAGRRTKSVQPPRWRGTAGPPDLREPAARRRAGHRVQPGTPIREDQDSHRPGRTRPAPPARPRVCGW